MFGWSCAIVKGPYLTGQLNIKLLLHSSVCVFAPSSCVPFFWAVGSCAVSVWNTIGILFATASARSTCPSAVPVVVALQVVIVWKVCRGTARRKGYGREPTLQSVEQHNHVVGVKNV